MNILITNDDGIDSPGIKALEEKLKIKHRVVVVAPAEERSGFSNALTFIGKVKIKEIDKNHYKCSGTPADCVHKTMHNLIKDFFPDIVVSGINVGPNLGTDIIYSGTCGAARQAVIMGVPGVAVSIVSYKPPFFYDTAAEFIAANIDIFVKIWHKNHFLNINVPNKASGNLNIMVTNPSKRFYNEKINQFINLEKEIETDFDYINVEHDGKTDTDSYAVENNMISRISNICRACRR
jgi:5'-nucleotidase